MKKTVIYILSSLLLIAVGVILLYDPEGKSTVRAIGTSVIAGGIASIAFSIICFFDDFDARKRQVEKDAMDKNVFTSILDIEAVVNELAQEMATSWPDRSRIFGTRPDTEVKEAIQRNKRGQLEVDCVGITLKSLNYDIMETLKSRDNVKVRLLQMDPRSELLKRYAEEQGEDPNRLITDICETSYSISGSLDGKFLSGEVRWHDGFQSGTLIRINNVIFARMRLVREASATYTFFERYRKNADGKCFQALSEYFNNLWKKGQSPNLEFCKENFER